MFTGIINHTGSLWKKEKSVYTFKTSPSLITKLRAGTSIAVDGACLTVVKIPSKNLFSVEIMAETAGRTIIDQYKVGILVNLELPATPNTFLSGHIVQGHIDGVGMVEKISQQGNSRILTVSYTRGLKRYIVSKGSITINGISLTVIGLRSHLGQGRTLTVGIIPYTWEHTMLKNSKVGDKLNIEVDILAKYIWQKI